MALPNLIIAGLNKAGTTSLHNYLSAHPDVCAASVKETFFWNRVSDWNQIDLNDYAKHFNHHTNEKVVLESTPRYFHDIVDHLKALDKHLGDDLKIILLLRDPVKRLHSYYKYKKRGLEIPESETFIDFVDRCFQYNGTEKSVYNGLKEGLCAEDLRKWTDHFGNRLEVHFSDDLKEATRLMESISTWLGIDPSFYHSFEFTRDNESVDFKNQQLQSIGIKIFRRFQGFWNRMPGLKRGLTSIYHKINGKPFDPTISSEVEQKLNEYYSQDLQLLRKHFEGSGKHLPSWLG